MELTEKEEILETNEARYVSLFSLGYWNKSFKVKLREDIYGIFKPKDGERDYLRPAVTGGTYYKREYASYLVDKFLGFNLIPTTIIGEIDGKIGSLQEFIPDAKTTSRCKKEELEKFHKEFLNLFALDYIIYNSDRNWGNCLVAKNKFYAIDNGLTFGNDALWIAYAKKYIISDFSEIYVITEKIKRLLESQDKREKLQEILQFLLKKGETDACFARMEYFTQFISKYEKLPIVRGIFFRRSKTKKIMPFWP